ncbi:diguanylate cyclase [Rhizobium sp. Root274]|uniref:PAS domain-containing protein n=1 Tax=unclassified Rhizobium TaxID=2613769 RepID=UPI00071380B6|nr:MULTISPECIES: PAS domain-containing protein [unclassified Rhizobium]KQW28623.1 diguanylate cyclase [Rhizobium sp. Root1240]KRD28824.1 diguanylate cyclase [Rhizobium sp. Root274]
MSFGEFRDANLRVLSESISLKNRLLQQAIRSGNDELVRAIDREIEPLLTDLVSYRATDTDDIYLQMRLVTSLIREDADDRACVLRHASMLSLLVERYFGPRRGQAAPPMHVPISAETSGSEDDEMLNETILNNLPERIAVVTRDYRYLFANPPMASMLGAPQMDLIGRSVLDICLDSDMRQALREALDAAFAGRTGSISAVFRSMADGTVMLRARYSPLRASQGVINGAVLTFGEDEPMIGGIAA